MRPNSAEGFIRAGAQLERKLSASNLCPEGGDSAMEWLTLNEAAAYLKVKPRTLAQWVRSKKVPGYKLSGTQRCIWRFLQSELDAMLTADSERGVQAASTRRGSQN